MKKILIIILILIAIGSFNFNKSDDLIRIRIIANSNSEYDQKIKQNVSKNVKEKLYELLKEEKSVENARKIIKRNISSIETIVNDNLEANYGYEINYGMNYFPQKEYKGKVYKEGNYESLLIKLGEAKGDNWWCILFPPICLIEAEESEDVEYGFFIKDLFTKFFK